MTELELKQLLSKITRPDETARTAAHAHWASLAKPLGGLGRLETMLEDAAALTGTAELAFSRRAVLVLCADNGVVAQGVSQTDQSVTRAVAENLAARRTSVCQMAKTARCEVVPVDMGMAGAPVPGVVPRRIAAGTADFTQGPAMTRTQAVEAIAAGIELVRAQKAQGCQLLATGEMGIGNTTTSAAVLAALTGEPVPAREDIEAKKQIILRHGLALWDTLESCTITGASDASIRDVVPNDIAGLLAKAPIEAVFCNGATAYKIYTKYLEPVSSIPAVRLPSTSPANAACRPEKLREIWQKELSNWILP